MPPIGHEQQTWNPPPEYALTRRERSASGRTYRSAVPVRIGGLAFTLPTGLIAEAEEAASAIARFDESTQHGLGGIAAVLLRSESASSSQIEQISASARAIAEAELTGSGAGNAAVVADNMQAMTEAVGNADTLTAAAIVEVQRILLARQAPHLVGWRTEPVWIGGGGSTPVTADYVGPDHRRIPDAIDDLIRFASRDDLPLLPQIAVAHAQFETIHPFADGNGRTGRALVQIMLKSKQLTRTATVPLSGGLLVEKERYFDALGAYRTGDAAPIIHQFCRAALRAVRDGQLLTTQLSELRDTWRTMIKVRADSSVWKIIDLLPAHPVIDAETVAALAGIHPNNVRRAVEPLVAAGILVGRQHYRSHKYLYRAPQILDVLDDYAAKVGRRQR
ncbi:MAG TPA: Fic family protein [Microlunatus sp.]